MSHSARCASATGASRWPRRERRVASPSGGGRRSAAPASPGTALGCATDALPARVRCRRRAMQPDPVAPIDGSRLGRGRLARASSLLFPDGTATWWLPGGQPRRAQGRRRGRGARRMERRDVRRCEQRRGESRGGPAPSPRGAIVAGGPGRLPGRILQVCRVHARWTRRARSSGSGRPTADRSSGWSGGARERPGQLRSCTPAAGHRVGRRPRSRRGHATSRAAPRGAGGPLGRDSRGSDSPGARRRAALSPRDRDGSRPLLATSQRSAEASPSLRDRGHASLRRAARGRRAGPGLGSRAGAEPGGARCAGPGAGRGRDAGAQARGRGGALVLPLVYPWPESGIEPLPPHAGAGRGRRPRRRHRALRDRRHRPRSRPAVVPRGAPPSRRVPSSPRCRGVPRSARWRRGRRRCCSAMAAMRPLPRCSPPTSCLAPRPGRWWRCWSRAWIGRRWSGASSAAPRRRCPASFPPRSGGPSARPRAGARDAAPGRRSSSTPPTDPPSARWRSDCRSSSGTPGSS